MKYHANIPVFIPHLGCPNQCVFCNQRSISGVKEFKAEDVRPIIDEALSTISDGRAAEIAFFGGSFTGIDRELMTSLLKIANEYIEKGCVTSLRCSTRPDYINDEIIEILKKYSVNTVELGLQSSNDHVLMKSGRGHDFECERRACKLIIEAGLSLVGQMMIGLPGSTLESELDTADFIINSGATSARIYPTVVFHDTALCEMAKKGIYSPLSLIDAVKRSAAVLDKFDRAGIEVIRIGLCASENLVSDKTYYAGPNHSALGELVENELYYNRIYKELARMNSKEDTIYITVARGALSKAIGQKKSNKVRLSADFSALNIKFSESEELFGYDFRVDTERN